jgi:ABC-type sugar transport system ATPase subunit
MAGRQAGDVILDVRNISLRFGGVKALSDITFDVREHEIRAIIGPNGAGKSSMLNCINGVYQPQEGSISLRGKTFSKMNSHQVAEMGVARTFQNLALFKGMSVLDNIMTGRNLKMKTNLFQQALRWGAAEREETAHRRVVETSSTSSRSRRTARRRSARCRTAAEARRPRPGAGDGAAGAAPRRADGGNERRGEAGHEPLHPRRQRRVRHDDRPDRARHGRRHGHLRPRRRPRLRQEDRRRQPDEVRANPDVISAYLGTVH